MKYITTLITVKNNLPVLEPVYTPPVAYGEDVYLRVVAGNVQPSSMTAYLSGSYTTEMMILRQTYPSIWETRISPSIYKELVSHHSTFTLHVSYTVDNSTYELVSPDVYTLLGSYYGRDHDTDISDIYDKLHELTYELQHRSHQ